MESVKLTDDQSKAVQKAGAPRVSLDDIEAAIVSEEYIHPMFLPEFTICVLGLKNGFVVLGESAPADPANFNAELGRKFARENAIRKVWPLMGYALRERISSGNA